MTATTYHLTVSRKRYRNGSEILRLPKYNSCLRIKNRYRVSSKEGSGSVKFVPADYLDPDMNPGVKGFNWFSKFNVGGGGVAYSEL